MLDLKPTSRLQSWGKIRPDLQNARRLRVPLPPSIPECAAARGVPRNRLLLQTLFRIAHFRKTRVRGPFAVRVLLGDSSISTNPHRGPPNRPSCPARDQCLITCIMTSTIVTSCIC